MTVVPRADAMTGRARDSMSALFYLNVMRLRAALRSRLDQLLSERGVLFVATIALFLAFLHRSFASDAVLGQVGDLGKSGVASEALGLGLLVGCVVSAMTSSGGALQFSQAETNLLLASPLPRAAIVINKCLSYIVGAMLSALLLAVLLPAIGLSRPRLFLATLLCLVFVQMSSASLSMVGALATRHLPLLPGRKVLAMGMILVTVALLAALWRLPAGEATSVGVRIVTAFERHVAESDVVRAMLSPFAAVAGLYLPDSTPDQVAARVAVALALIGCLFVLIVLMDRHLLDESENASLAGDRRWQRMLRSGQVWQRERRPTASRRPVRMFGRAGTLAWVQALRLVRTSGPVMIVLPLASLGTGALLGALGSAALLAKVAPLLFFMAVFLLPKMLVFDFRGAFETIDKLQTLPLSPRVLASGQLATPILFASMLWWLPLSGAALFATAYWPLLLGAALLAVPLNTLLYATENLGFLLAPARPVPVGRMDFDFLGRTLVDFLAKCLVLAAALAIGSGCAWLAFMLSNGSPIAAAATALVTLFAEAGVAIALVAVAFQRFDATRARS